MRAATFTFETDVSVFVFKEGINESVVHPTWDASEETCKFVDTLFSSVISPAKWLFSPSRFDSFGLIIFRKSRKATQLNNFICIQVNGWPKQKIAIRPAKVSSVFVLWTHCCGNLSNFITRQSNFLSACTTFIGMNKARLHMLHPGLFIHPWSSLFYMSLSKNTNAKDAPECPLS